MAIIMADIWFVGISIVVVMAVTITLSALLLLAETKLFPPGPVTIEINEDPEKSLEAESGQTLLTALGSNKIYLPSACGGSGSCGVCKCRVLDDSMAVLPTEKAHLTLREMRDNWHLACQVKLRQNISIQLPPEIFDISRWECEVLSNRSVATFIKEFTLKLPEGETLDFKPGGYIQIEAPPFEIDYSDIEIADRFRDDWDSLDAWSLKAFNTETITRAYSMANHPAEGSIIKLNVRIATPPYDGKKKCFENVPPGIMSSYIFSRKPGDHVTVSGPFGEFFIKDTSHEMCYIGGGAGMAPLRSHIFHLFHTLKTNRKVSYWYGARSLREVFYEDEFRAIEKSHPNFSFHLALSDPQPDDNWSGLKGFIHQVVHDEYLHDHHAPEDIEYYLCGPPMMTQAAQKMLYNLGVGPEMIAYDDFGN